MTNSDQYTFNLEPGAAERDRAIEQVTAHGEVAFINAAREALERCCFTMETFTTDEIWALIPEDVVHHEPRAMAAIMKFAQANNWAYPLDQYRPSSRPKAHRGPKRVWRSRVYAIRDALQPSYEEAEREPVDVNRFDNSQFSPEMYRELHREIPVECPHGRVIDQNGLVYCRDCHKTLV